MGIGKKCNKKTEIWHFGYNLTCGESVYNGSKKILCEDCKNLAEFNKEFNKELQELQEKERQGF